MGSFINSTERNSPEKTRILFFIPILSIWSESPLTVPFGIQKTPFSLEIVHAPVLWFWMDAKGTGSWLGDKITPDSPTGGLPAFTNAIIKMNRLNGTSLPGKWGRDQNWSGNLSWVYHDLFSRKSIRLHPSIQVSWLKQFQSVLLLFSRGSQKWFLNRCAAITVAGTVPGFHGFPCHNWMIKSAIFYGGLSMFQIWNSHQIHQGSRRFYQRVL